MYIVDSLDSIQSSGSMTVPDSRSDFSPLYCSPDTVGDPKARESIICADLPG